jgi:hypothetical protein
MAQQLYRVVEASWDASGRVETDIGCTWKPERAAKEEARQLKLKDPARLFSVQKKPR